MLRFSAEALDGKEEIPRHNQMVNAITTIPGTTDILTASGSDLWVWDGTTGSLLSKFTVEKQVETIAVSPGGLPNDEPQQVAFQCYDDDQVYFFPTDVLTSGGGLLTEFTTIKLSDLRKDVARDERLRLAFNFATDCRYLAVTSSNETLITNLYIINLQWPFEYNKIITVEGHMAEVQGAVFSPDNLYAISWCSNRDWGRQMILWDLNSLQEIIRTPDVDDSEPYYTFTQVTYIENTYYVAAGTSHGELHIINTENLDLISKVTAHGTQSVSAVRSTEDGSHVVTCGDDGWSRVWQVYDLKEVARYPMESVANCMCVNVAPDGSTVLHCGGLTGSYTQLKVSL